LKRAKIVAIRTPGVGSCMIRERERKNRFQSGNVHKLFDCIKSVFMCAGVIEQFSEEKCFISFYACYALTARKVILDQTTLASFSLLRFLNSRVCFEARTSLKLFKGDILIVMLQE
jgi:hypothetical protein